MVMLKLSSVSMESVHRLYVTHLNRTCEVDVVRRLKPSMLTPRFLEQLSRELAGSDEASAVSLQRKALRNWWNMESLVDQVNQMYVELVERLPSNQETLRALASKSIDETVSRLLESSDARYLAECRSHLPVKDQSVIVPFGGIAIKYCFPLGTSGIAKVSRDIIRSLVSTANVFIELECTQFHGFGNEIDDDLREAMRCKLDRYDYVVAHGIPEFIPVIAKRERMKNRHVLVYAIVAWETDRLPFEWIPWLLHADKISCPSEFNALAFRHLSHLLPPVDVVHHPIVVPSFGSALTCCPVKRLKDAGFFVFYNISEWSNRKGLTELIECFAKGFKDDRTTWLYLKTCGDVSESEGHAYLKRLGLTNVTLDYTRVSDSYIDCIHRCGDSFVSMTKAEGHFIGACQAHLMGKPVIVTGASGHLDYISSSSANFIPATEEPAKFCTDLASKHKACKVMPHCIHFTKFVPCQMKWFRADPESAIKMMKSVRSSLQPGAAVLNEFTLDKVAVRLLESIQSMLPFTTRSLELTKVMAPDFSRSYCWTVDEECPSNVLVINAGAYGNVGDHLYNHLLDIIAGQQSHQFKLTFITDNEVVIQGGRVVHCESPEVSNLQTFDAIVIGGGGLLSHERLQSNTNLLPYAKWAQANTIPLYLLSVGFQDLAICENGDLRGVQMAEKFRPLLQAAQYISVRSLMDHALCMRVLDFTDINKVHYHPDLVYSMLEIDAAQWPRTRVRDTILIIFSENSNVDMLFPEDHDHDGHVIFANFAGNAGNATSRDRLNRIRASVHRRYPDATFYDGLEADANESPGANLFSIREIIGIMQRSKYVYTVRQHGYILARVCGVPTIVLGDYNNYKTRVDVHASSSMTLSETVAMSRRGADAIFGLISTGAQLDCHDWTNDQRNSAIVRLARRSGQPIHLVQTLTNRDIQLAEVQVTMPPFVSESSDAY